MSTMQQQTPPAAAPAGQDMEAAVEAQMGKIVTELGAALGVLLTSLGTRSGLWAALAGAGPLTTADVAAKVSVEPSLVREWLRAQAAGGYLDYDPANETFTLPDAVAAAICYGPGGALVDACATMMSSMGEGFAAFSEAFSTGQGFGWHQRTADHWHGTDAFTRVALPTELIEAAVGEMAGVATVLAAGGTVADVGCGYGTPTLSIAGLYPSAQVLGVDYHDASIAHARAEAARSGVSNVRFEVAAAADLPGQGYDLITFFDSLHDIGDPLGALVRARAAVAPAGAVLLFEPLGADDRPGQPQPERAHVLRRLHARLHAERGVPEDADVLGATGRTGRREAAAGTGRRRGLQQRPQARRPGPDEPGLGTAPLTSHDGAMSPAVRLIGRESALAAAGSVLGDALSGSGQFLMISGEAGIGKTATAGRADRPGRAGSPGPARVLLGGRRRAAVLAMVTGPAGQRSCRWPTSARRAGCCSPPQGRQNR